MARALKHEAAITRSEALLCETAKAFDCPHFFRDADRVIASLRQTRPKETPLALHFIAIAVKELLERRADGAKMCLILAQGMAEPQLRRALLSLFCAVFHRNEPCSDGPEHMAMKLAAQMAHTLSENLGPIMEAIRQGGGLVKLGGGVEAKVTPIAAGKKPLKQPVNKKAIEKKLPPVNPWN